MNSCSCKDWEAIGNLFHEAIGMIHIKYCPWCRSELYQREVLYVPQNLTGEEPPDEPEAA